MTSCLLVMLVFVVGGAILFSAWEGWDYVDGSYFCFTSLLTIGFGDFVPGNTIKQVGFFVSLPPPPPPNSFPLSFGLFTDTGFTVFVFCFTGRSSGFTAKLFGFFRVPSTGFPSFFSYRVLPMCTSVIFFPFFSDFSFFFSRLFAGSYGGWCLAKKKLTGFSLFFFREIRKRRGGRPTGRRRRATTTTSTAS